MMDAHAHAHAPKVLSDAAIVEAFSVQQQTSPSELWGDGGIINFFPLLGSNHDNNNNNNNNNNSDSNGGTGCPLLASFSKLPPLPPPPLPQDVIEVDSDLGDTLAENTSNKNFSSDMAESNEHHKPRLVLSLPTFPIGCLRTDKANLGKNESSFGTALLQSLWPPNSTMREDEESNSLKKEYVPTLDFSVGTISDAPTTWLRHMQAVFKELLHNRVEEWKELLATYYHDVEDAQKLVTCLTKCQSKLLVSCRGHTTVVNVTAQTEKEMACRTIEDNSDETESHTSSILECTERATARNTNHSTVDLNSHSLGCELKLELLAKLRKGPRSFATSCYTMHFVVPIIATFAVHPSDGLLTRATLQCDPLDILRPMQQRVEQIVLKAVASHASETPGMAPRWKNNPKFLSKLWHVQNKNANLAPLARGFCSSSGTTVARLGRSDDSSVSSYADISIRTSSTLSSLGSRSVSTIVPADIITTVDKGRGWRHSLWFRGVCQVLSFVMLLFAAGFVLRLHSIGKRALKNAVQKTSIVTSTFSHFVPSSAITLSSFPSMVARSNQGVSFQRIIHDFPQDHSNFTLSFNGSETHCQVVDGYGPNKCHYDWKEHVLGKYHVQMDRMLNESASLEIKLMLDNRVPYSLSCPLCGQDCVLQLPVVKVHYTIPMPPCPVSLEDREQAFAFHLWRMSPTDGWLTIPISGTGQVYETPDALLASFEIHVTVR